MFVATHIFDHLACLKDFAKTNIPIYLNAETLEYASKNTARSRFNLMVENERIDTGSFLVVPFPLKHTSVVDNHITDCQCFGFLIAEKSSKEKMLWITDTQYIHNKFPPMDYICVECNYMETEVKAEDMQYLNNISVETRRIHSHMSAQTCVEFLKAQDLSKCKFIKLLHMSSNMTDGEKQDMADYVKKNMKSEVEVVIC